MLIFPSLRMGFYVYLKKSISLNPREKKKVFTVTAAACQLKGRFTFLERSDYTGRFSTF